MALTVTRMRYLVRKGLGNLSSTDIDDTDTDELLDLALWDIEDKFEFQTKHTTYGSTLVTDQFEYDISGITRLDAITAISWIDENGRSQVLERMTRKTFDLIFDNAVTNTISGPPTRYLREGDSLYLWPPPSSTENGGVLQVAMRESVASLTTTGTDETDLPRNWDILVVQGAIAFGHFFNQDYDLAKEATNMQLSLTRSQVPTESKEEEDSRYAGLDVIHDRPSTGSGRDFRGVFKDRP